MKVSPAARKLVFAVVLVVSGVLLPVISPLKILLEPASFTFGVHVPIFLALFVSPVIAVAVVIGTTLGFALGGFPSVIVIRAASHMLFAVVGALYIRYRPRTLSSFFRALLFACAIGAIHASLEVTVVEFFYMSGDTAGTFYTTESAIEFVGLGGFVHNMVDFALAFAAMKLLKLWKAARGLFPEASAAE
ncbi:MAG: hypothetical protein LBM98_06680 [Oscillospiraceae bacterium]|jgi:niacin transporter|nr:hypothetical protein [Oscillospiraceae bacterium]